MMRFLLLASTTVTLAVAAGDTCSANFTVHNGVGINGKSTQKLDTVAHVMNVTVCCGLCEARADCVGFTWHDSTAKSQDEAYTCSMIKGGPGPHDSTGAISGVRVRPPAPPAAPTPPPTPAPTIAPRPLPLLGFQPNIVFILTDDQDVEMGGLEPMPKARALLGGVRPHIGF